MMKFRVRKRLRRVLAGILSAAMTMTMVPEIWMPIYAENVRNEIMGAEIPSALDLNIESVSDENTETNQSDIEHGSTESKLTSDNIAFTTDESVNDEIVDKILYENSEEFDLEFEEYEFNGKRYAYFSESTDWKTAKEKCEALGGHLAFVNSAEEQKFFTDIVKTNYTALGGWDEPREGIWTWTDGSEMVYTNWNSGEPNNGNGGEHQNHLFMLQNGKWDDGFDYIQAPFICEWENAPIVIQNNYAVFSGSRTQALTLYGWKSNFDGNIYTGNSFNYNGSELYVNGKIDSAGMIMTNGWIAEVTERNEYIDALEMPDYDKVIHENAQPCEYFEENPAYVQDRTVVNSSIKVEGDVIISGTIFEGDCYIIAEGDITYNVQSFESTGRVFLYSRNGNITINGSQINVNGAMYAPKGNVTFNTYDTTVTGFICADSISFNGSIFNITGANFDMVQPKFKGIIKTYTTDNDFNEGTLNGVSLTVPDQLILADKSDGEVIPAEKIYGDTENGKGVKIRYYADKSVLSENDSTFTIGYD